VAPPPARRFVRNLADQRIVRAQEITVRRRAARGVERLRMALRQVECPLLGVQRVDGVASDVREATGRLHRRPRGVGVVEHHVVRIDQVHREEPRPVRGGELARLAAQPAAGHRGRDAVVQVAALRVGDDVTDAEVVREAVLLHLGGEDLGGTAELVDRLEFLVQVPLALVGGVVAGPAQQVADGRDVVRHALDPGEVRVVEHARLLDVPAAVEHRSRRRADARIDRVVHERRATLREPLVCRQREAGRQLPGAEKTLLVREDEQDVVWAGRRRGSDGCRGLLRRAAERGSRGTAEADRRGTGRHQELPSVDGIAIRVLRLHLIIHPARRPLFLSDNAVQNETRSQPDGPPDRPVGV